MNFLNNYKIVSKNHKFNLDYFILEDEDKNKYFAKKIAKNHENTQQLLKNEIEKYKYINQYDFIPKIIEYGQNYDYVIYEYIDGISLNQLKGNTLIESLIIFKKICECVHIIHNTHLIHCDLKSSNIMLKENKIYIIDFGNCHFLNEKTEYGSKIYCSVEQLMKQPISFHFDYYSLAVVFYEIITGKLPYENKEIKVLVKEKNEKFPLVTDYILNYPKEIDYIIKKLTSNQYKNLVEAIFDIDEILNKQEE